MNPSKFVLVFISMYLSNGLAFAEPVAEKKLFSNESDEIYAWDISYLTKQLLDSKYQLNTDSVKEYFEMNNTITGMFAVYKKILNKINYKEV